MQGRVSAQKRQAEKDLILAYNTGAFARASGKQVKSLRYYLSQLRDDQSPQSATASAFNFFSSLKARGMPIEITRTVN